MESFNSSRNKGERRTLKKVIGLVIMVAYPQLNINYLHIELVFHWYIILSKVQSETIPYNIIFTMQSSVRCTSLYLLYIIYFPSRLVQPSVSCVQKITIIS